MDIKGLLIVCFSVVAAGCSTVSPKCTVNFADGPEAANVVVYRPHALVGVLYSTPMSINRCRVNDVDDDTYFVYRMPEGIHRFSVEKRALELGAGAHVEQLFEVGETYYLRQNVSLTAGLVVVSETQALLDMPRLKGVIK